MTSDTTYRHSTRHNGKVEYTKKPISAFGKHFTNVRVATEQEVKVLEEKEEGK